MQVILGSGGAIGTELAKSLRDYTRDIRLVSRSPQRVHADDQLWPANLLDARATMAAVEDAEVAYLTVGLPYRTKVWRTSWPKLMRNAIDACRAHDTRLVFFDNVYMYDSNCLDPMTEETPVNPSSEKGAIRAEIARMLLDETDEGTFQALIARSADYYGPSIESTSVLNETVVSNLSQGKKANWLGSAGCKHSYTYTPDAGKATALLGNTPEAYNQVWHLPTASDPPTGREWIEMIAEALEVKPRYREVPAWMVRLMGLFNGQMRELVEMMYQYDRDYVFDSGKFEKHFNTQPTPYPEGVRQVIVSDYES